jgi:hypothetical protein
MSGHPCPSLRSAAASGGFPSRSSNTSIVVHSCLLGLRADRIAPYKVIRQAGAARGVRGALCERDARLDTSRPRRALCHQNRDALARVRAQQGRSTFMAKPRVRYRNRGETLPIYGQRQALVSGGTQVVSRLVTMASTDADCPPRLVGTYLPLPRLREGLPDEGDAASGARRPGMCFCDPCPELPLLGPRHVTYSDV